MFLADSVVGGVLMFIGFQLLGTIGDLLLVEVGFLAIVGGLVEFSRSKGAYELRRVAFHSKEDFSTTRHVEASKKAVVFVSTAAALFLLLVAIALLG